MVERITIVETKIDNIDKKLSDFVDSADKRFAAKWTEKLSYFVIGSFVTAIVTKIVGLW